MLSCPWNFQARILEWVAISFKHVIYRIFISSYLIVRVAINFHSSSIAPYSQTNSKSNALYRRREKHKGKNLVVTTWDSFLECSNISHATWRRKWQPTLQYSCLGNPMDRGAWLQSMGSQTVGLNRATKQQQL